MFENDEKYFAVVYWSVNVDWIALVYFTYIHTYIHTYTICDSGASRARPSAIHIWQFAI